jgi:hypothetical protein
LDDRVDEMGASGSGEETSSLRRSFAPVRAKSSADTGRGWVLSWAPRGARLLCNSVSLRDSTGAGLVNNGSVDVILFRAHGLFCEGGVTSRGVRSCVSEELDGGVLGPYKEASFPALACGEVPHFGGGVRRSVGLLRMRLSRSIIRCSSKVFSRQATGSWPGGTSAFDSFSVTASLRAMVALACSIPRCAVMASLAALMVSVRSLAWFKKVDVEPLGQSGRVEVSRVGVFSCSLL